MAKLGIIHYNLKMLEFEPFLDYMVETGFQYCELPVADLWDEESDADPKPRAEAVRRMLDDRGLTCSAVSSRNDFVVLDEAEIASQVARMEKVAELALVVGANVLRTEGGSPKDAVPPEKHAEAIATCMERCLEFAERMDIKLAMDNHGFVTNDGDLELEIFERVGNKRVGANIDTMNYRWAGHELETIDRWYEQLAPWCLHTHMKDGTGCRPDYVGAALGEGEIHLDKVVASLRAVGYDGVWCAEYEGQEDTRIGYAKCLEWMKKNL